MKKQHYNIVISNQNVKRLSQQVQEELSILAQDDNIIERIQYFTYGATVNASITYYTYVPSFQNQDHEKLDN